jgi:hypothetical protein
VTAEIPSTITPHKPSTISLLALPTHASAFAIRDREKRFVGSRAAACQHQA